MYIIIIQNRNTYIIELLRIVRRFIYIYIYIYIYRERERPGKEIEVYSIYIILTIILFIEACLICLLSIAYINFKIWINKLTIMAEYINIFPINNNGWLEKCDQAFLHD